MKKKLVKTAILLLVLSPMALLLTGCGCNCGRSSGGSGSSGSGSGNNNQGSSGNYTTQQLILQTGTFTVRYVTIDGNTMNRMQYDRHLRDTNPGITESQISQSIWSLFEQRVIINRNHMTTQWRAYCVHNASSWQDSASGNFQIDTESREITFNNGDIERVALWRNSAHLALSCCHITWSFQRV